MLLKYFLALFIFTNVFAFRLSPLSHTIILGKNKNTVIYQVTNNTKSPMALEASVTKRIMDKDGSEKLPPPDKDTFIVYPSQLILKPKEKRGIKVTWLGAKDIKEELSYRLKIEQLPIDFEKKDKTGIKILMRYLGALYVSSSKFTPKVVLKSITEKSDDLIFTVANEGTSHKLLKKLKIVTKNETIESEVLKDFSGENLLSKSEREFSVKRELFKKRPIVKEVSLVYE